MKKGEEGLDKAYDDTVNRIEHQGQDIRELAKNALFWIIYANRPLTTEELRHDLAVEPGTCRLDETNLCLVKDIVSSCAGLVAVDSNIIRLVHCTTQEYFQRHGLKSFEDVQRDIIATSCLTYLSYDVFADGYLAESHLESRLQQNAFFKIRGPKLGLSYPRYTGVRRRSCFEVSHGRREGFSFESSLTLTLISCPATILIISCPATILII